MPTPFRSSRQRRSHAAKRIGDLGDLQWVGGQAVGERGDLAERIGHGREAEQRVVAVGDRVAIRVDFLSEENLPRISGRRLDLGKDLLGPIVIAPLKTVRASLNQFDHAIWTRAPMNSIWVTGRRNDRASVVFDAPPKR